MKKVVENIELFNKLLSKYLSKKYINNASRLIRDYNILISEGKLYYIERNNYLFFLENCKEFYNLYYFISESNLFVDKGDLKLDRPVVADEIYTDNKLNQAVNLLLEAGFKKYLTRIYKTLKINEKNIYDIKDIELNNVKFADKDDVDFIVYLQNKYIDKYTGNILSKEDILSSVENKLILGAYEGNDFAGYLRFGTNKKSIFIEGIAIGDNFRGKGYSKQLINYLIDYSFQKEYNKIDLWVRDDNISALKLYDFFGFEKTKYKCDNYIKY